MNKWITELMMICPPHNVSKNFPPTPALSFLLQFECRWLAHSGNHVEYNQTITQWSKCSMLTSYTGTIKWRTSAPTHTIHNFCETLLPQNRIKTFYSFCIHFWWIFLECLEIHDDSKYAWFNPPTHPHWHLPKVLFSEGTQWKVMRWDDELSWGEKYSFLSDSLTLWNHS